jgi:hypothetical protein
LLKINEVVHSFNSEALLKKTSNPNYKQSKQILNIKVAKTEITAYRTYKQVNKTLAV